MKHRNESFFSTSYFFPFPLLSIYIFLPFLFISPSFCSIFPLPFPTLTQQLENSRSLSKDSQAVHEHLNRPTKKKANREASKRRVAPRCFTECIFHRIDATLSRQSSRGILHKISFGIEQAPGSTSWLKRLFQRRTLLQPLSLPPLPLPSFISRFLDSPLPETSKRDIYLITEAFVSETKQMLDKDRGGEEKRRVCIYIYVYKKGREK